jgi:nucleoside-diphosphate-sugar epimerase
MADMQNMSKNKKAVVTGGAGFIGSHIVDALIKEGYEVHVVDNLIAGKKENVHPKAVFHKVDIRDVDALYPIIAGAEYVFHTAARPRVKYSIDFPAESHDVNVNGTFNVLLAAKEGKVKKVIYSASSSAYGDQDTMPLREDMRPNPKSPYGLQKYYGELQCKMFSLVYGLPTISLRYFTVYGPRMTTESYPLAVPIFIERVKQGKTMQITGDGMQTRDFTSVYDVVHANMLAAKSDKVGKGEVINIGAGCNHSLNELAKLIGGEIEYIAPRFEPKDTLADNSLAKKLLGWKPEVTFEKGIQELKKLNGIK